MLKCLGMDRIDAGVPCSAKGFTDVSFSASESWLEIPAAEQPDRLAFVLLGDETVGPQLALLRSSPGSPTPAPVHLHASDTLRIVLRGEYRVGRDRYGPGSFRFQAGWRAYSGEDAKSSDGTWLLIVAGDRRGTRARLVDPVLENGAENRLVREMQAALQRSLGVAEDDWNSDDPRHTSGPSALQTTIGRVARSGKLHGSFGERSGWCATGPASAAAVGVLGDPVAGPVIVLSHTAARHVAMPQSRFGTELFRVIVAGSGETDGRLYQAGDMRLQPAHEWCGAVTAGSQGLQELLVFGDRRHLDPDVDEKGWPAELPGLVDGLVDHLTDPSAR